MTNSKQPKPEAAAKKPAQKGELSETALNAASGGALNAYMPTDQSYQTGGSAKAAGDGSVKTNSALIGLPKVGGN
jgi:hypothetical protein